MKGQEAAPIELLLGVIILSFVIIIAYYTYNNVCASQYTEKVRSTVSDFARTLEAVYQGGVGTSQFATLDFAQSWEQCSASVEYVSLVKGSAESCKAYTGFEDCLQLMVLQNITVDGTGIVVGPLAKVDDPVEVSLSKVTPRLYGHGISELQFWHVASINPGFTCCFRKPVWTDTKKMGQAVFGLGCICKNVLEY